MIDFHSHILPGIDDGSDNILTTISMLQEAKNQGVEWIVASPHYYPTRISFDDFISNRKKAMDEVKEVLDDTMPKVLLGAEVAYYYGISNLENILDVCIEGTNVLLLEMPMGSFQQTQIDEVLMLQNQCGLKVVLAHIERYLRFPGNKEAFDYLNQRGILFQVNANYFQHFKTRSKACRMFKEGYIYAIGSDCHNMETRPPNINKAVDYINKKGLQQHLLQSCSKIKTDLKIIEKM